MSDKERGGGSPGGFGATHDLLATSLSSQFPALPTPPQEFEDPLSPQIAQFLNSFARAAKGLRVYATNNQMLKRYLDDAYQLLAAILESTELTLSVRDDRLLYGKDPVHVNADRDEGIPFTLYRNAFRRITLMQGMAREEMVALLGALITDYRQFDYAGEDLSTELWRLSLPHLRYLTIDVMAMDTRTAEQVDRVEIERIQDAIEDIVAHIYKTQASDDIVAGVTITKEDLEALKEIRQEQKEDLDLLDVATARAIVDIAPEEVGEIRSALSTESRDSLSTRLIDILVIILFKEQSSSESTQTIELIKLLYDSLLVSQRYEHALHLIGRLKEHQTKGDDLKTIHIAGQLLRLFSTEARVMPVLNNFNDAQKQASVQQMLEFLRSLGPSIVPILLSSLDFLTSPAHRRLICDLILEYGVPDKQLLWEKMQSAKWFVVRDILGMAQRLPLDEIATMVNAALKNEHPKVREHAVGLLRGYARGTADKLVAERLGDADLEVRMAAIRVAAARRSIEAKVAIEAMLAREDLSDREPRELRLLMAAYAAIAGWEAVNNLDKVLNPGFFARSKMTEAQIAAAFALASIGTQPAMQSIQKGLRTLNTRVRDACKKALAREFAETSGDIRTGDLRTGTADLRTGDLRTGDLKTGSIPKLATPAPQLAQGDKAHPTGPLVIPHPSRESTGDVRLPTLPPVEPTPPGTRSARFGAAGPVPESAPDFVLPDRSSEVTQQPRIPVPLERTIPNAPRPNLSVGRVALSGPVRDEMPMRFPIAPDVVPEVRPDVPAEAPPEVQGAAEPEVEPQVELPPELPPELISVLTADTGDLTGPAGHEAIGKESAESALTERASPADEISIEAPVLDFEDPPPLTSPSRPVPKAPPPPPPKTEDVKLPRFAPPEAKTERQPLPPLPKWRTPVPNAPNAPNVPKAPKAATPAPSKPALPPLPPVPAPAPSPPPERKPPLFSPADDWAASIPPDPNEDVSVPSWAADLTLEGTPPRKR